MTAAPELSFPEFDPKHIFVSPIEGLPIFVGWLPLAYLKLPRYQRPEPEHRVSKMTDTWDIYSAGTLYVSFRSGVLWLVDGQTRKAAATRRGLDRLPACVVTGMTEVKESEMFLHLNRDRLPVTALSRHRAEAFACEPRAIAIDEVLTTHALYAGTIAPKNMHVFKPISKAELCFGWGGPELLDRTLTLLTLGLPDDSGRYQGKYVAGLGFFLSHDSWGADDEKVLKVLSRTGTAKLEESAHHLQQLLGSGGKDSVAPIHMARAIASKVYPKRIDWKPEK